MIDEAATFEKFGYYSTDLKPHSHKQIIAVCDGCAKIRELKKCDYHSFCHSCCNTGENCTEATRKKLSEVNSGEKNSNYGKHPSEVTRQKMSKAHSGKSPTEATKKKLSEANRGKKITEVTRKKLSEVKSGKKHPLYGKHPSEVTRKKLSEANRGKKHTEGTKKKLSESKRGAKNHNWKGGKSIEYCSKWNEKFREYIRNKYNRKCFLCGKTEEENGQRLSVHHVNSNKKCGCDEDRTCQFVPLCRLCHGKVHGTKINWEKHITEKQCCDLRGWYI